MKKLVNCQKTKIVTNGDLRLSLIAVWIMKLKNGAGVISEKEFEMWRDKYKIFGMIGNMNWKL